MGIDRFSGVSLLEEIEKFNQSKSEQELLDPTLRSWISIDRLRLKPFFTAEDINQEQSLKSLPGQFPFTRGYKVSNNDWVIQEVIKTEDLAEANLKGLDALDKGAESLAFRAKQFSSVDDFAILLDGIDETKEATIIPSNHPELGIIVKESEKDTTEEASIISSPSLGRGPVSWNDPELLEDNTKCLSSGIMASSRKIGKQKLKGKP